MSLIRKRSLAFGLVEVIVALGIAVVLMTGSVQASLKAAQQVRKNELQDEASGIMLRSLELSRSAVKFNIGQIQGSASTRSYKLGYNNTGVLTLQPAAGQLGLGGAQLNCPSAPARPSEFAVEGVEPVRICNAIIITRVSTQGTVSNYEIRSLASYEYLGENFFQELISYRTE